MTTQHAVTTAYAPNPFARDHLPEHVSAGTVSIESERAISEAQGKLVIAKRFPRDQARAYQRVVESCSRPNFAAGAEYAFPRGGQTVRGPSIRLAEELARIWGNLDYGTRELSRKDGVSEMEAYCWDLETNTISSQKFTVRHIRDTKAGGKALSEERDVYELTANQGGRRLRARILAILPPDLVDAAVERCRETLAGNGSEPLADRVRKMLDAFARFGVLEAHLSAYLNKSLDQVIPTDLADLASVFNSIKTGTADPSDFFARGAPDQAAGLNAALAAQIAELSPNAAPAPAWPRADSETGELIDVRGVPWLEAAHSAGKTCMADGRWRPKRGIDPAVVEQAEAAAMRAPTDQGSTEPPPADPQTDAPTDGAPEPGPAAEVLAGIGRAKSGDDVDGWLDEARLLDLTDDERAQIETAASARRAELSGG